MFGFEFALYTFLSAVLSSILAKRQNRDTNMWWLAGLLLGVFPAIYLFFRSFKREEKSSMHLKLS